MSSLLSADDTTKYVVMVSGVNISPNPVKKGKLATFNITAHTNEALSEGKLNIEVKLFGISVYSEDHNLCQEITCPVAVGDFVISHSHELLSFTPPAEVVQQGTFESYHRDMMIGFGKWEFEPMDLQTPFPNNEGSVHLCQGDDDYMVPVTLQRYIAENLPWIHYHELPNTGHMFPYAEPLMACSKEL